MFYALFVCGQYLFNTGLSKSVFSTYYFWELVVFLYFMKKNTDQKNSEYENLFMQWTTMFQRSRKHISMKLIVFFTRENYFPKIFNFKHTL